MSVTASGRSTTFQADYLTSAITVVSNAGYATLQKVDSGGSYYFVYIAKDGTRITFRNMDGNDCISFGRCAYASNVLLPNGTSYDLSYDNPSGSSDGVRLRRVVSNAGYALIMEYFAPSGGNNFISKACALNLSDQTLPGTNACPAGVQTTSYTYSGDFMSSATDAIGQQWTFANTYVDGTTAYTFSFFKPGAGTAYLVNSYDRQLTYKTVDRQDFSDGRYFTYGYREIAQGEVEVEPVGTGYTDNAGNHTDVDFGVHQKPTPLTSDRTRVYHAWSRNGDECAWL